MTDESKAVPLSSNESSRTSIEQSQVSPLSRPNSARRKSWLPANTRDPVVTEPWCSEVIHVLKAVDEHLTSGFDTAYPPALTPHCSATVWADFIKDINKAAKLKRKHKFVLSFRPMVSRVKVIRNAINAKLDKRTKPMLMMLNYWQDILKTYGLRAELRKGGQSIDKRLITPPSTSGDLRSSELFTSGHSSISSSRSVYRSSMLRGSTSDLQEFGPIRPAYLQSNSSRASLASHGSFAFGEVDTSLSGNWELVLYSYKKRSEMRSMYRRSRRYSTMSITGSSRSGRPTTAMMLGDEASASNKTPRRQSRSKLLSPEDLAKLPLPAPRSPFSPSEPDSIKKTNDSLEVLDAHNAQQCESNENATSCELQKSPLTTDESSSATKQNKLEHEPIQLSHDNGMGSCDDFDEVAVSSPAAPQGQSSTGSDDLHISTTNPSMDNSNIKIAQFASQNAQAKNVMTSGSGVSNQDLNARYERITHTSADKAGIDMRSAQRPDSLTHSPLSSMAMTAQRMSADLDETAETMHRNSVHKLNNRFSVSNFLHLASSVLTQSNKDMEDGDNVAKISSPVLVGSASDEKALTVVQKNEIHSAPKSPRPHSSSFMTVVATPVMSEDEVLEPTTDGPTLRVVTSQQLIGGSSHEITEVKSLLSV